MERSGREPRELLLFIFRAFDDLEPSKQICRGSLSESLFLVRLCKEILHQGHKSSSRSEDTRSSREGIWPSSELHWGSPVHDQHAPPRAGSARSSHGQEIGGPGSTHPLTPRLWHHGSQWLNMLLLWQRWPPPQPPAPPCLLPIRSRVHCYTQSLTCACEHACSHTHIH